MPLPRFANNYSSTLAADVTDIAATSISVTSSAGLPALAAPVTGLTGATVTATQQVIPLLVGAEIMYVTAVGGTTLTVSRGREGTTATTHATGAAVNQIITRDSQLTNSHPGGVNATLAVATGQVYTPDLNYKYHWLTVSGATSWQIGTPAGGITPEVGHEVRFHYQVVTTALNAPAVQPTYSNLWTPVPSTGTTISATAAIGTQLSVSFAYKGLSPGNTTTVWRRIQ